METKKKNNFLDIANEVKSVSTTRRKLKLEKALDRFLVTGENQIVDDIKSVVSDLSFSNRMIHVALSKIDVNVSESAVRRYRVKYGIVEG